MGQSHSRVEEGDFSHIGGEPPSYLAIEAELVRLGGGGPAGTAFKLEALRAAGWTGHKMTSYGSRPAVAAAAFNRIREVLSAASGPDELLSRLRQPGP